MAVIPNVAPDELIESSWGNAVANELNTAAMKKAGGTFTGLVNIGDTLASGNPSIALNTNGTMGSVVGNTGENAPSFTMYRAFNAANTGQRFLQFTRGLPAGPTVVGSVAIASTTTVAYNTTSDERTKHRDGDVTDAAERIVTLAPRAFVGRHYDDDGNPTGEQYVFLYAHDIAEVAPWVVTGERGETDAHGRPIWQQVNYPGLVPLLVAALGNALDRITALEAAA